MFTDFVRVIVSSKGERGAATVPLVALTAIVAFFLVFARAVPLTDDWFFLKNIMAFQGLPIGTVLSKTAGLQLYDHHVAVPMLLYMAVSLQTKFDARYIIFITILVFVAQYLLYRLFILKSDVAALPIALIVLGLAHWMEYLWACEFTFALSVLFATLGLIFVSRIDDEASLPRNVSMLLLGLCCIVLGVFSSAGAVFGFVGALVVCLCTRCARVMKMSLAIVTSIAFFIVLHGVGLSRPPTSLVTARNGLFVLTEMGGLLWGTPELMRSFRVDARSVTGACLIAAVIASTLWAVCRGRLHEIALPLGLTVFGGLALASIAASRDYLGNWHLQYGLPFMCGGYCCIYFALPDHKRIVQGGAILVTATAWAVSAYAAFTWYGPAYAAYTGRIEDYMVHFDASRPLPFARPIGWSFDQPMADFLKAHHHPAFATRDGPADR